MDTVPSTYIIIINVVIVRGLVVYDSRQPGNTIIWDEKTMPQKGQGAKCVRNQDHLTAAKGGFHTDIKSLNEWNG